MRASRLGGTLLLILLAACASAPPLQPRPVDHLYGQELRDDLASMRSMGLSESALGQSKAQLHAGLAMHEQAISDFDSSWGARTLEPPDLSHDVPEDAIAAILHEAASRQVVILNEAHHVPMHRAFAMRLARELRKLGFEYLAAEAFGTSTDPNTAVLSRKSGYVGEPMFAEFVRDARRDGWKLVAYESRIHDPKFAADERIRLRERVQAKNLIDRIFSSHPKAKVFIYVGFSHAAKQPLPGNSGEPVLWMAGELKRQTGIDPLSIDQSWTFAHPETRYELSGYRNALARSQSGEPFVLKQPNSEYRVLGQPPSAFDMQVFHLAAPQIEGRQAWLSNLAGRRAFAIPASWLPSSGRRLIYAMHAADPPQASPADIVIVEAGKPAPALMLPPGQFRFEFEED